MHFDTPEPSHRLFFFFVRDLEFSYKINEPVYAVRNGESLHPLTGRWEVGEGSQAVRPKVLVHLHVSTCLGWKPFHETTMHTHPITVNQHNMYTSRKGQQVITFDTQAPHNTKTNDHDYFRRHARPFLLTLGSGERTFSWGTSEAAITLCDNVA